MYASREGHAGVVGQLIAARADAETKLLVLRSRAWERCVLARGSFTW